MAYDDVIFSTKLASFDLIRYKHDFSFQQGFRRNFDARVS